MAQIQVDVKDELQLLRIKEVAIKNDLKTTKTELILLALKIASDCSLWLDSESFEQVTNLKK